MMRHFKFPSGSKVILMMRRCRCAVLLCGLVCLHMGAAMSDERLAKMKESLKLKHNDGGQAVAVTPPADLEPVDPQKEKEIAAAAAPGDLTDEQFKTTIADKTKHVVVFFYSPWSGHCKRMASTFVALAKAHKVQAWSVWRLCSLAMRCKEKEEFVFAKIDAYVPQLLTQAALTAVLQVCISRGGAPARSELLSGHQALPTGTKRSRCGEKVQHGPCSGRRRAVQWPPAGGCSDSEGTPWMPGESRVRCADA